MRISTTKTKNFEFVYLIKDFYSHGSRTTKIVEKLGTMDELREKLSADRDGVLSWAKSYAKEKTALEKEENRKLSLSFSQTALIGKDQRRISSCGYLFLQALYSRLKLGNTFRSIKTRHKYSFNLDAILSDLIFARILAPSSKASSYETAKSFLEPPKYALHDVYRALSILSDEADFIQSEVYKNSNFISGRNRSVLYYDCTNYYFETEQEDGFRCYGKSKEHRPNPIVQMGLFMDGDGIPLAFDLFSGNRNEQGSLKPLEKKIIKDFEFSRFIVCTDAGLGSEDNRFFNSVRGRSFIVTQSLKKLSEDDRLSAFSDQGWRRVSDHKPVSLQKVMEFDDDTALYYKELPYTTKKLQQRLIITYSPKYAAYQKRIREAQIQRVLKLLQSGSIKRAAKNPNDPARFITRTAVTSDGEIAECDLYTLDQSAIGKEAQFDGFYAVCTDLFDDGVESILKISEQRWQIEESFRILKTEFQSRPVFLRREDRIRAHFLTCFLSLLLLRILEKELGNKYTVHALLKVLRSMQLLELEDGYLPAYDRNDITDVLHEVFGFRTDFQIISKQNLRNIIKQSKQA